MVIPSRSINWIGSKSVPVPIRSFIVCGSLLFGKSRFHLLYKSILIVLSDDDVDQKVNSSSSSNRREQQLKLAFDLN